jgi:nucleotidyltransferase/DNA polymerase involved in DNA repair
MSLDEAYLDITSYVREHACTHTNSCQTEQGDEFAQERGFKCAEAVVEEMRERIFQRTGSNLHALP